MDAIKPVILCVDDEINILNALSRVLRKNYQILISTDPKDGLKKFEENQDKIEVVVSDLKMPAMNGIQFLKRIKNISPQTICIVLSGKGDFSDTIEAINNNLIYKYISKPWRENELLEAMENAVNTIRKNRMLKQITDTFLNNHQEMFNSSSTTGEDPNKQIEQYKKFAKTGILTSKILHDINNEITLLSAGLSIIKDTENETSFPKTLYDVMQSSLQNIFVMIEDVQNFIADRHISPRLESINLNDFFIQKLPHLKTLFTDKPVEVVLDIPSELSIRVDPEKFSRVITNLTKNAAEATLSGSFIVQAVQFNKGIEIRLTDTGKGMPAEVVNKIFTPYATFKDKGHGMGLVNVKEIIEMHGGTVAVESVPEKGTAFIIFLPQKQI